MNGSIGIGKSVGTIVIPGRPCNITVYDNLNGGRIYISDEQINGKCVFILNTSNICLNDLEACIDHEKIIRNQESK